MVLNELSTKGFSFETRGLLKLRVVTVVRVAEKLLREFGGLPLGDHPAYDVAVEEIDDGVQEVELALVRSGELGDVPGPRVVGRARFDARHRESMRLALRAPLERASEVFDDDVTATTDINLGQLVVAF